MTTEKNNTQFITTTALMTALICILGPMSIPIGPVPISLQNLAIYITIYVLGTKRGTIAYVIYLILGLCGLPVLAGYSGGVGKIVGPTGGYLIGFIPMALCMGILIKKHYKNVLLSIVIMEVSTWIAYLLGTAWLAFSTHTSFGTAFSLGVAPFIILDLIKMVISAIAGPVLRDRLRTFTALETA